MCVCVCLCMYIHILTYLCVLFAQGRGLRQTCCATGAAGDIYLYSCMYVCIYVNVCVCISTDIYNLTNFVCAQARSRRRICCETGAAGAARHATG